MATRPQAMASRPRVLLPTPTRVTPIDTLLGYQAASQRFNGALMAVGPVCGTLDLGNAASVDGCAAGLERLVQAFEGRELAFRSLPLSQQARRGVQLERFAAIRQLEDGVLDMMPFPVVLQLLVLLAGPDADTLAGPLRGPPPSPELQKSLDRLTSALAAMRRAPVHGRHPAR
jgi:hypothetical protein